MKIVSIVLSLLLLFFINLFFVKSIYKNEQSYNVPLNVLFSKGKHIRKRLCNECFFKNEINMIYNSCRALESVNYNNFNRSKIFYFVKESPKMLKRYVSLRSASTLSEVFSVRFLTTFLSERASLLTNWFYLLEGTYIKNNILRGLVGFFGTLVLRFLGEYYNKFSPSDVKMPGVYSNPRKSLNKDMKYATKKEIQVLRSFCKETGCHTCGVSCHDRFIGDHQPPVQVIKDMVDYYKKKKLLRSLLKFFKLYDTKQRLYPQCVRCSQLQSASVRCKKLRLIPHYNTNFLKVPLALVDLPKEGHRRVKRRLTGRRYSYA
ncbi:hypothetical protein PVMG_01834 [Plasmodium vivax Mauritania I]|uniref:Uncharacterized protein n=1 Tax=Plasmodium vivax Mauritania I TaxID=1035515 RepID=A0A0J9THI5_PLAVI|nr:hypothetical protein PVMG_01834 [Plasmodium vivax Mauritania I]